MLHQAIFSRSFASSWILIFVVNKKNLLLFHLELMHLNAYLYKYICVLCIEWNDRQLSRSFYDRGILLSFIFVQALTPCFLRGEDPQFNERLKLHLCFVCVFKKNFKKVKFVFLLINREYAGLRRRRLRCRSDIVGQ